MGHTRVLTTSRRGSVGYPSTVLSLPPFAILVRFCFHLLQSRWVAIRLKGLPECGYQQHRHCLLGSVFHHCGSSMDCPSKSSSSLSASGTASSTSLSSSLRRCLVDTVLDTMCSTAFFFQWQLGCYAHYFVQRKYETCWNLLKLTSTKVVIIN